MVFNTSRSGAASKFTLKYSFTNNDPGLKPGVPKVIQIIKIERVTEVIDVEERVE